MFTAIEGTYRSGKIELAEVPAGLADEVPAIVTFLSPHSIDLRARGIDRVQAADLRARLATFAEDWDSPEMAIYDNYDAAKSGL